MQSFVCLLTSLALAMHAVLGCPCGHRTTLLGDSAARYAAYAKTGQQGGYDERARQGQHKAPTSCPHASSNYVQAKLLRVDVSPDAVSPHALLDVVKPCEPKALTCTAPQPIWRLDLSGVQLYVWHCALII